MPHAKKPLFPRGKLLLARLCSRTIDNMALTQQQAGRLMSEADTQVSRLVCGHVKGFSLERLLFFVRTLGWDIDIRVTRSTRAIGTTTLNIEGHHYLLDGEPTRKEVAWTKEKRPRPRRRKAAVVG